jgi:hypothetical protein
MLTLGRLKEAMIRGNEIAVKKRVDVSVVPEVRRAIG